MEQKLSASEIRTWKENSVLELMRKITQNEDHSKLLPQIELSQKTKKIQSMIKVLETEGKNPTKKLKELQYVQEKMLHVTQLRLDMRAAKSSETKAKEVMLSNLE